MKKFILLFVSVLMLASCSIDEVVVKEALITNEAVQDKGLSAKTGFEVGVCHNGKYKIVQNEDALNAHIAHGDAVDRDGDGFYHIDNPCSETDCDDTSYSEDNSCIAIGDLKEGGIVFWIDPLDNKHGLVCALSDYPSRVEWGCYGTDLPDVPNVFSFPPSGLGAEIGDGMSNTNGILKNCPTAQAASAARSLGPEWFLPSIKELDEMYKNKATLEAVSGFTPFANYYYWSSTEFVYDIAWFQYFNFGFQSSSSFNKFYRINVRAVRAF